MATLGSPASREQVVGHTRTVSAASLQGSTTRMMLTVGGGPAGAFGGMFGETGVSGGGP